MAVVWILTVFLVTSACWIQVVFGSCPAGMFGDSCGYSCHCGHSCNQTTGVCAGACDSGWVGGKGGTCQKENVAYGRQTSSPTRLWANSYSADKAVDGNRDQNVFHGSCFNTYDNVASVWKVDLGDRFRIHDVRIYHQQHYLTRIRTAVIYLSNTSVTPSVPCYSFSSTTSVTGNGIYDVVCDGIGRHIIITDPTHLNLCEVEIYVCSPGVFGDGCENFCHCLQAVCDPVTGFCPGDCRPGWKGDRCDAECDADHYGINCMKTCANRKCSDVNSSCDRHSGSCDKECLPGWIDVDCTQECNNETYGLNCSMACSERKCNGHSSCDHVRGTCVSGCLSGWKGEDCNEACDSQHYGPNCIKICASRHCVGNSSCNSAGDCDGRCEAGWTQTDCTSGSEVAQSVPVAGVVGAVVGAVLVTLVIILIVLLIRRRRQKGKGSSHDESVLHETSHVHSKKKNLHDEGNTYMNVGFDEEVEPTLSSKKTPTTTAHVASGSASLAGHHVEIRKIQSRDKRDNVVVNRPVDSQGQLHVEDEEDYDAHAQIAPQEAPGHADINYYNLGDARPCHAIPVTSFAARVHDMEDHPEEAEEEFKRLPDGFMHSYEESQKAKNKGKNRFRGYYPYDYNRVILHGDNGDSTKDYINASYLDGYKGEKRYIAAQGPYKPDILVDFWKMIWQEGCSTVVMVTGLMEGGKMKCLQYWPEKDTVAFGDIKVTLAARTQLANFTITKLTVQNELVLHCGGRGYVDGAATISVPSYASLNGFFLMTSRPDKEEMWSQVYNSDSHTLITYAAGALDYIPSVDDPVSTTRFEVRMSKSTALCDDIFLNSLKLKLKDNDDTTVIQHYHIMGSARDPKFNLLTNNFLKWTSDPKRSLCTLVMESVEEVRLLVLLLNIASRLQDDGRVDVINNMRQLYRRVGGSPFTEIDVRLCLEFTRRRIKMLGVYANT